MVERTKDEMLHEILDYINKNNLVEACQVAVCFMLATGGMEVTSDEKKVAREYKRQELEGSQDIDYKLVNVIGRYFHGGSNVGITIVRYYVDKFITEQHPKECNEMVGD